ncbi:hypothetical protein C9J01_06965 [Photobacterium rosenbergii]|uniref:Uncharacterized protein n=1 Tax=Photobacterium rosenbergii TaxID=294936 RepID=A0A2T3NMI8_9GAMM|nr:hypothetical protein [Photobacterium rosenbergii]PSW16727.1 hypothetical protein C9J01_06965 [Photobacterium rosenbergii]
MNKYIEGKTVYQLPEYQFNALLASRAGSGKKALKAQKDFELVVIDRGWAFHKNYEYTGTGKHVLLVSPNGKGYSIPPSKFRQGGGAKLDFETNRKQFLYTLCESDLNAYLNLYSGALKSMLEKQLEFERNAISRGWTFPDSYRYERVTDRVSAVAPSGETVRVQPNFFLRGGYKQYQL